MRPPLPLCIGSSSGSFEGETSCADTGHPTEGSVAPKLTQRNRFVSVGQPAASSGPRRATAKSFFESRSNTVRAGGGNPARFELAVRVGTSERAAGVMQSDGVHRLQVNTSGGHVRGQITSQ